MQNKNTIPVLIKALDVICTLAQGAGSATTKELSQRLNIPFSTCYRILQTFTVFDWLRPSDGGRFEFSLGLLPLLEPFANFQRLFDHLREPLERLVEETQLMAKISVRQGSHAVTVYRVESPRRIAPSTKVGTSFPLAYGSSGACLMCGMDDDEIEKIIQQSPKEVWENQTPKDVMQRICETRSRNICCDDGSYNRKIFTASVPIFGVKHDVCAAISVIGWPEDFNEPNRSFLMAETQKAARLCEALLKNK